MGKGALQCRYEMKRAAGGFTMIGLTDLIIGFLWVAFLIALIVIFLRTSRRHVRRQFLGTCCVGILLSLPAIGKGRAFGISLPTLAFMTAVSIAFVEVCQQFRFRHAQRYAFLGTVILGLAIGICGGIRRSEYVAESLQQDCAARAERDGEFLFDLFQRPATIPEERRQAGIARLSALGIKSKEDARNLQQKLT